VRSLDPDELRRALTVAIREFMREVRETAPELAHPPGSAVLEELTTP
jgi:hypothetical protein